ncbi:MAG: MarR family transcriptional regulator [Candidatus Izemoplasma sp.]|nr:MarR family transcriptional regulator [Candidatus Izemoplasma sp.]
MISKDYDSEDILKLDNQLCFRLYSVSRKMTKTYQPYLNKYNLTYPQYIIMLVVFEKKVIDFKELSEKVNLRTGTLTPILKKLEQLGYINRVTNQEDKRKLDVILSEKGEVLKEHIVEVPIGLAKDLQVSLDMYHTLVEQLDALDKKLDEVIDAYEK